MKKKEGPDHGQESISLFAHEGPHHLIPHKEHQSLDEVPEAPGNPLILDLPGTPEKKRRGQDPGQKEEKHLLGEGVTAQLLTESLQRPTEPIEPVE